jgi:predicted LPLAT superfamily acyltransferase
MPSLAVGANSAVPTSMRESTLQPDRWSRIGERGSLWGMRFTAWCYRIMGRRVCSVLVHAIVAYFFLTDRKGRRASVAYLRRIYATPEGRAALRRSPGRWESFLHYREFALSIVDRLGIWFGRVDTFDYEMVGEEHLDRLAEEQRGAILLGAHLGSFDALRLLAKRKNSIVNVLMFTANANRINTLFRDLSPEIDAHLIRIEPGSIESVFEIRACLQRGELVAILGDRIEPGDQNRTLSIPLLGDPVKLSRAPFMLANLLGCPVLTILAFRETPGHYSVFAERLVDRIELKRNERNKGVEELLTAYAGRLEHYAKRYPFQWFNFFDFWEDEVR